MRVYLLQDLLIFSLYLLPFYVAFLYLGLNYVFKQLLLGVGLGQ